ncbi:MAG: response regulator transcription factor [Acidobacteria bacterium]|nr:response regulator transcription factor [Acidobacteriota bacterium]
MRPSPWMVNNHIQNILKKLNAHTRLEAVRRAEYAGLI